MQRIATDGIERTTQYIIMQDQKRIYLISIDRGSMSSMRVDCESCEQAEALSKKIMSGLLDATYCSVRSLIHNSYL